MIKQNSNNPETAGNINFRDSICGSIDFASHEMFIDGGTVTGTLGPSVSLSISNIDIPVNNTKRVEKTRYMDINEINFDGVDPADKSAYIARIESNLGVKVVYPVGPEGDDSMKVIGGVTSDGNYLLDMES